MPLPAKDLFGDVSTADTGVRQAFDFYETPAWMTRALLAHHPIRQIATTAFEPCGGRGAIARVLNDAGLIVLTNDVDVHQAADLHGDATHEKLWSRSILDDIDWVITNPPFLLAFEILQHAVLRAKVGVAMLLRKTFLEPTETRGEWLAQHPPSRSIGLPRHNFRGKGSDSCAADWFIWERHADRSLPPFVIDHLAKGRR